MTRTLSTKIAAVGTGLAGLALAGGLVATAAHAASAAPKTATAAAAYQAAAPSPNSTATDTSADAETNDDGAGAPQAGDAHQITGSVKAPESATEQSESAEQAALAPLAKITAADAQSAGVKAHPGATAGTATLQDADGYVVYQVPVTVNGQTQEVVVDAGNGQVMATEQADGNEAGEGHDGPEQSKGATINRATLRSTHSASSVARFSRSGLVRTSRETWASDGAASPSTPTSQAVQVRREPDASVGHAHLKPPLDHLTSVAHLLSWR